MEPQFPGYALDQHLIGEAEYDDILEEEYYALEYDEEFFALTSVPEEL